MIKEKDPELVDFLIKVKNSNLKLPKETEVFISCYTSNYPYRKRYRNAKQLRKIKKSISQ